MPSPNTPSRRPPVRPATDRAKALLHQENADAAHVVAAAAGVIRQIAGSVSLQVRLGLRPGVDATEGAALQLAARQRCHDAAVALRELAGVEASRAAAFRVTRRHYADFRHCIKTICAGATPAVSAPALGTSRQLRPFVIEAAASYLAAVRVLPAVLLSAHGYPEARLHRALLELQDLAALDTLVSHNQRHAVHALARREHAMQQLNRWMGRLLSLARVALAPSGPPARCRRSAQADRPGNPLSARSGSVSIALLRRQRRLE